MANFVVLPPRNPLTDLNKIWHGLLRRGLLRNGGRACMTDCLICIQVAQLSQRDRAAGWVSNGPKWKTGTERQYLRTIYVYIQPLRRIWPAKKSKSAKKRKIRAVTPFKVIQGHRDRYQSKARMRLPISD